MQDSSSRELNFPRLPRLWREKLAPYKPRVPSLMAFGPRVYHLKVEQRMDASIKGAAAWTYIRASIIVLMLRTLHCN